MNSDEALESLAPRTGDDTAGVRYAFELDRRGVSWRSPPRDVSLPPVFAVDRARVVLRRLRMARRLAVDAVPPGSPIYATDDGVLSPLPTSHSNFIGYVVAASTVDADGIITVTVGGRTERRRVRGRRR